MTIRALGYEVIGTSVFGPMPIGGVHLESRSGTTMLYGKNGSGKTRLLEGVSAAFQGVGSKGDSHVPGTLLHVAIGPQPATGDGLFLRELYEILGIEADVSCEDEYREKFQQAVMVRADAWGELYDEDPMELLNLPEFSASQGFHLSLEPSGTVESPSWLVYLSAILSEVQLRELRSYGHAMDEAQRAIFEDADTELLMKLDPPFILAQAKAWYAKPFTVRAGSPSTTMKYVVLGPQPIDSWPSHFPIPMVKLGRIRRGPVQVFVGSLPIAEIQEQSLALVSQGAGRLNAIVEGSDSSEVVLAAGARHAAESASREANAILGHLGDFPFDLKFETGTPSEWFAGNTPRWVALPHNQEQLPYSLGDLSFSQQKWTRFALSLFLRRSIEGEPLVIVLDEPEQGLHRQLEARLAKGIQLLSEVFTDVSIIGATHSPAFLDARHGTHLQHLTLTGAGETLMTPLEIGVGQSGLDEEADRLGITTSDILSLTRVAVIVEGTHDQIVVEECLSRQIHESAARVFVMRGTENAAALPDMQFLFDALDASIIVVFDNVVQSRVAPIWQRSVAAAKAGDRRLAERSLEELASRTATKEERALVELGRRAIQLGKLGRIHPFGLKEPDVLDYLSPRHFNLDFDDWHLLKLAYRRDKRHSENFKVFLRREFGARINNDTVRVAAQAMTSIPGDLEALGDLVRSQGYLGFVDDLESSLTGAT